MPSPKKTRKVCHRCGRRQCETCGGTGTVPACTCEGCRQMGGGPAKPCPDCEDGWGPAKPCPDCPTLDAHQKMMEKDDWECVYKKHCEKCRGTNKLLGTNKAVLCQEHKEESMTSHEAEKREAILSSLQGADWVDEKALIVAGGLKFSVRLRELKDLGHDIEVQGLGAGQRRYRLLPG